MDTVMATIVRVKKLTKQYGKLTAVDRISFEMEEAQIASLLGPNGVGKTTTIHMLLTLISPTSGDVQIFGKNFKGHREELIPMMNFTAPYSLLPYNLTTMEALTVFALLYGVKNYKGRVRLLIDEFDLGQLGDKKIGRLSSGEQVRIGMAKAFVNSPRLLLLDEPTVSLDPVAARDLRGRVLRLV